MSKGNHRLLRVTGLLAGLPIVIVGWLVFRPLPTGPIPQRLASIELVGYTNDPAGAEVPLFRISNRVPFSIDCRMIGPQTFGHTNSFQTPSGWRTKLAWGWIPPWTNHFLRAGEDVVLPIAPPPNTTEPWRAGVFAEKPPSLRQRIMDRFQARLPERLYWLLRGEGIRNQMVHSQEIQPRAALD